MKIIKNSIILLILLLVSVSPSFAQNVTGYDIPQTLSELQDSIQKILIETNTNGAAIVMVSGDSIVLLRGFGKADIENDIDVNENTMFRLGSVSKIFVSLAILKLQEDEKLNLKDKVSDIIPEIKIENPWKDKHPIRIENLLEHTAGLSDWSWAELGSNDLKPKTLKESLEYYPKARVAKYIPGTRIQYSNLGVSIAAYIVEKVSGMAYEDYVAKYFFKPLGMKNATFRNSEQYKNTGAKCYDNKTLLPYLNILYRPSAALTASPKELANLLRFFILRGEIDSIQLLSNSSINRMERNESLSINNSELFKNQGLGNAPSYYKSFIYRGHGGSVPGSNADFQYLPEYNLGYAIMINGDNESLLNELSYLIKKYQTKDLSHKNLDAKKKNYKLNQDLSGYYINVNYKFDLFKFKDKIKSLTKIWYVGDTLFVKNVLGQYPSKLYPSENNVFKTESGRYYLFQETDPVEGKVLYGNLGMLKRISPIYANTLLIIFWALFIVPLIIIIFAVISLLIYLFGKKKNKTALWFSLWPLISISFLLFIVVLYMSLQTRFDIFLLLGNFSWLSLSIFIGTIGFALTSLWTIYYIYKNRKEKMAKISYYLSVLVAFFNLIFTIYFFSNGLIGIITWI
jgi:CubicO group peptidase (beta-lactamase class C family)